MARSRQPRRGKSLNRLLYVMIPVVALVAISVVYALTVLPQPAAPAVMDFQFKLMIQFTNRNSTQVRNIAPLYPIGEAGGYWLSHEWDSYGVNSQHYPLYMDAPDVACQSQDGSCLIHVKSRAYHNFTLGDFFTVWGKDLGENKTTDLPRNGNFAWEMCLGAGRPALRDTEWGALLLKPNLYVQLVYFDTVNGLGCSSA